MRVFISYTRRDPDKRSQLFGKKLAKFLSTKQIDVIFDEISFKHSKNIANEMIDGIYSADKFIFLASPKALRSNFVQAELNWARDRAIRLLPETFFHVVIVSDDLSSSDLPPDLTSYLCHQTHNKSELKLLYEIFLSLKGIIFGDLIKKMLAHNPDSVWVIPELYRKIIIHNENGDATISTLRTMLNISDEAEYETRGMYIWADGDKLPEDIRLRAFTSRGKDLIVDCNKILYRGLESFKYKIIFDDPVFPDEVISFWTSYDWENTFDLLKGDKYPLSCEDMIYGYLRLNIVFPRNLKAVTPKVTISSQDEKKECKMKEIGDNIYSYSTFETTMGYSYIFHLKCLTQKFT